MDKIYKSNITLASYKYLLLFFGIILGVIPLIVGLYIVLPLKPEHTAGAFALAGGFFVIWVVVFELFIKPSIWSMIVIEKRVIWNSMRGIEYVKFEDIDKIEIFPGRQDDVAIRFLLMDGTTKNVQRDNCRNVLEFAEVVKEQSNSKIKILKRK